MVGEHHELYVRLLARQIEATPGRAPAMADERRKPAVSYA
jgi:hypothetical protein